MNKRVLEKIKENVIEAVIAGDLYRVQKAMQEYI